MMSWLPAALAAHLWQSTWCVGVVWLATLALRRHGARLRYWLWTGASVKFLVPFSWLIGIGAQFEWRTATVMARPAAVALKEVLAPSVLVVAPATLTQQTPMLPWLLAAVWLAGSAAALFWWWRQWLPVRAALRAATPVTLPGEYDVAGLAVMASPSMFEPGVIGFRRPVLLVPEGLVERLTPAQMNALVAHERSHVRYHDNFIAAIHMAVEVIFWFHPLVWWIAARQVAERERACDEAVLRAGSQPSDYAESILTVCRWSLGSPVMCVSGITGSDLRTRIEMIMANRVGRRLSAMGRMLLAAGATALLAGPVGLGLFDVEAQSSTPRPQFDVASVKADTSLRYGSTRRDEPQGITYLNITLGEFIRLAYGVQSYQIEGPEWITNGSARFDIVAKASAPLTERERHAALVPLLAERFHLKLHRETRTLPVYSLVIDKGGPKFKEGDGGESSVAPDPATGALRYANYSMSALAAMLSIMPSTGRAVLDRTGLLGKYTFTANLFDTPAGLTAVDAKDAIRRSETPVFTALREQLGLKLDADRAAIEILVIDSADKTPTAD